MNKSIVSKIIILFSLIVLETWLTVEIPGSRKYLYDALANKDMVLFYAAFGFFMYIMIGMLLELPYKEFLRGRLSQDIRETITKSAVDGDFHHKNITSPDGRIADDVNIVSSISLVAVTEIIIAVLCLAGLLWQTKADHVLLYSAGVYSLCLFVITYFFKKPLTDTKIEMQSAEQQFRRGLITEDKPMKWYEHVSLANFNFLKVNLVYGLFMQTKNRLVMLIIPIILLPMYMQGHITIGDVFGKLALFDLIISNATIILIYFPTITAFMASYIRVKELFN